MPSCNFYKATGKDVIDIANILKKFKEDLVDCDYPDIDNDKLNNFILGMLKKGKIICVKNLDDDKLIGVCIFYKTEYWWSKEQTMVIQLIYVLKKYRNYQVVKQLVDSVKQVSENLPISLSIIAKLNADKLLKRLGFEQMGNNWRLK